MTNHFYKCDLPDDLDLGDAIAIDCETMGLNLTRDRLCLVQLSTLVPTSQGWPQRTCAKMSCAGLVDAILSPDSDVFPFGATGIILKVVENDPTWCIEYVHAQDVSAIIGLILSSPL